MREFAVSAKKYSDESTPFIIAEVGHNHQGNLDNAIKLIHAASSAGASAAKFQKRENKKLFTPDLYNQKYNSENAFGETYGEHREALEFGINETVDLYETIEDFDDKYKYRSYNAIPEYNIPPTNLYLSVDENKGGIFTFTFESDTVPVASDFTYSSGSVETPDGDYDFIDKIFFKGQPLEIEDYIDNWGKASSVMIFTLDGDTIK